MDTTGSPESLPPFGRAMPVAGAPVASIRAIPVDEFEIGRDDAVDAGSAAELAAPVPIPAIPVAGPRYCRQCGAAWDAQWIECADCARRTRVGQAPPILEEPASGSVASALALYFTLLAICVVGSLVGGAADAIHIDFGVSIGLSVVTLVWCAVAWRGVLPLLGRVPRVGWFGAGIGMAFVSFAIATGVIHGLDRLMHLPDEQMSTPYFQAGYGWGMVILCVCVQPAVIEELAFRGVVMSGLQRALSPFETIIVSAMMFMILHLSPVRFPHTLALGMAAGYLRTRTRSIYPCVALHFSHNFLCVAAEWARM